MARKPNYDFQKHRRELDRKAEKAEKLRLKREKSANRREQAAETESAEPTAPDSSDLPASRSEQ